MKNRYTRGQFNQTKLYFEWRYVLSLQSFVFVLSGRWGSNLSSGNSIEPGVVDGQASKNTGYGAITSWTALGQNTDDDRLFRRCCSVSLDQRGAFVEGARTDLRIS